MIDGTSRSSSGHLLIAGTGRAGTSFLVRWLSELGLDTQLSRDGEQAAWDENANAGLETVPLDDDEYELPYVIKFPWLYQCIDHILAKGTLRIDAVIIPVRDLADAAASRTIVELQAMHASMPWIGKMDQSWEVWGSTPGGVAYSLNPLDQGRILAVGFHHLVQRLTQADIPVVFISYPRLVHDWRHLFDRMRAFLPDAVDEQTAEQAHRKLSDPDKVRVESELAGASRHGPVIQYPPLDQLDVAAMRRELLRASKAAVGAEEARALRDAALSEANQWREALNGANTRAGTAEWAAYGDRLAAQKAADEAEAANRRASSAAEESRTLRAEIEREQQERDRLRATLEAAQTDAADLRAALDIANAQAATLRADLDAVTTDAADLRQEVQSLYASRSWRLTQPYRHAHAMLSRLLTGRR